MKITHTRACAIEAIPHVIEGVIKSTGPKLPSLCPLLSDCYKALLLQALLQKLLVELFDGAIPAINGFRFTWAFANVAC